MKTYLPKKMFCLGVVFLFGIHSINAQITLEEAVQSGVENSNSIQSSYYEYQAAQWNQKAKENQIILPSLSFSAGVTRNLIIPSTPVPLNAFTGQGDPSKIDYLRFGTDWQSNLGLSLQYDIYNPANKQISDNSAEQVQQSELNYKQAQSSTRIKIIQAYAEQVLAKAQLEYAITDTLSAAEDYQTSLDLYNKGQINEQDRNFSQVAKEQSLSRYYNAELVFKQAQMQLSNTIGNKAGDPPPVTGDNMNEFLEKLKNLSDQDLLPSQSLDYQQMVNKLDFDEKNVNNLKKLWLPTVSLFASYGSDFYQDSPDFFTTDNWYGNSGVGVRLRVPILENISNSKRIQAAVFSKQKTRYELEDLEKNLQTSINKLLLEIQSLDKIMEQKKLEMELSEKNYAISREMFHSGRLTSGDLQNSRLSMENAKVNYLQSVYNNILAQIQLLKIIGF